ncbi:hypothetical protein [Variovorax saccharolyticus]|uniref:hypothetical protein n=1 Tax=Variovorax saccharolyticus TaxID=3053516 RepID=UPI002574EDCB|nr:hypothetical protein [Variovorax sp. J31P216]MDM0030209.1 hypothetical protein [Variovorax sp. J31P216]
MRLPIAFALCSGAWLVGLPGVAAPQGALLEVQIRLSVASFASAGVSSPGICLSRVLSSQARSMVRVSCRGGQVVSIAPYPAQPFLGVHGGAFRYTQVATPTGFGAPRGTGDAAALDDTVLQIDAAATATPLEMLISF